MANADARVFQRTEDRSQKTGDRRQRTDRRTVTFGPLSSVLWLRLSVLYLYSPPRISACTSALWRIISDMVGTLKPIRPSPPRPRQLCGSIVDWIISTTPATF